jgi:hypothetical protein
VSAVALLDTGADAFLGKAPHLLAQQLLVLAQRESGPPAGPVRAGLGSGAR